MENENENDKKQEKRVFSLKEAAAYLGISPQTLRLMVKNGVISCQQYQNGKSTRKTYFFSHDALDKWAGGEK